MLGEAQNAFEIFANKGSLKYQAKTSPESKALHNSYVFMYVSLQVFIGSSDSDTVVKHHLTPPIKARYIRLIPTAWNNHISMRMELYGCLGN